MDLKKINLINKKRSVLFLLEILVREFPEMSLLLNTTDYSHPSVYPIEPDNKIILQKLCMFE